MNQHIINQYYRVGHVAQYLGIGVSTIWYRAQHDPQFPKPFKLGERTTVWSKNELDSYVEKMKAKTRAVSDEGEQQ